MPSTPTSDEVEMLVSPEPLPVNVFEPMLILPKPEAMEPDVRVPTEERLVAVVRPFKIVRDEVARDETRPFVEKSRPFKEEARVVDPDIESVVAERAVAVVVARVVVALNVCAPVQLLV